jgi:hypothetical protein
LEYLVKGSQGKIHLTVIVDNVEVQADSLPRVSIYDADNDAVPLVNLSTQVIDEETTGDYSYWVTPSLTNLEKVLKVIWNYHVNGIEFNQEFFYKVNTTYSSVSDIINFLGYGGSPYEINYKDPEQIANAEKMARTIIDGYTNQSFSQYYGSQEQYGKGSDAVYLVERMLTIDKVWENDILTIDNTVDPVINTFGYRLEISPTGKAIRIINQGVDVRYDNQVDPNLLLYGRFRDGSRYKFEGQIGYKYVPEDIKIASMLLVGDILANDYNWRNKYLKKIDLSEISFEMAGGAFNGTGNVTVDNILDQYRNVNIVVI